MEKWVRGAQNCFDLEYDYRFERVERGQCPWPRQESLEGEVKNARILKSMML